MNEFLAMGGFGFYVWAAYGVTAVLVIVEVLSLIAHRKAAHRLHRDSQ